MHQPLLRKLIALTIALALLAATPGFSFPVAARGDDTTQSTESDPQTDTPAATEVPSITPIPTEAPTSTPTPTELSTSTPTPTIMPTETPTPSPTPTEEPPTPTAEPTLGPTTTPIPTVEPTEAPTETALPEPTETPVPVESVEEEEEISFRAAAVEPQAELATLALSLTLSPASPVIVGSSVTGQAAWSSAPAGNPTGTIHYFVFTGTGCTTSTFADAGTKTINNLSGPLGSVPASDAVAFPAAGSYSWQAFYSGDVNYTPSAVCVDLTVNKTAPTLGLTLAPAGPITAGATVTGTGTLTGANATASGTVTYTIYTDNACLTQLTTTGNPATVTVTNGTVPNSGAIAMNQGPTVYWQAAYSGDTTNGTALSACVPLTVNKQSPTIALTVTPTSSPMKAGGTATGTATLTGGTTVAGGTVTYTVYSNNTCTTQVVPNVTNVKTVTNRTIPVSDPLAIQQVGTFYWNAVYSGDGGNNGATSSCVSLVVAKSTPTLTLTYTASPVQVTSASAAIGTLGAISNLATGTVVYTVYSNSTCTTQVSPAQTTTVTVANGVAPNSDAFTFNTVGTVYWRAVYNGDANSNGVTSSCTSLTVSKRTVAIALTFNPSSIIADGTATTTAVLTNTTATAGGTVTYTLYSSTSCSSSLTATGNPSTKTVTNGVVPESTAITFTAAATRGWRAVYSGDTNNNTVTSTCTPFTIAKASPTVGLTVTPASTPMKTGGTARATATLTNSTNAAAGTVAYTVYTNDTCTTVFTATSNPNSKTVASHIVPISTAITFSTIGTFYWKAVYAGDSNNNGNSSPCVPMTVEKSTGSMTLTLTPTASPMKAGGTTTVRGVISNAGATAGGTIIYSVYSDSGCTTLLNTTLNTQTKTVTNRSAGTSSKVTIPVMGSVYWQAVYSGDVNNNPITSPCTTQTVAKSDPTLALTISVSSSPMKAGGTAYGRVTMSLSTSTAGGTATYTAYSDSTCTTALTSANNPNTKTVTNKSVPSSSTIIMPYAGTVYWRVTYTGDTNNNAATSSCVALTVNKGTPTISLTVSPTISPMKIGGTASGRVTMSAGTTNAGGLLSYTVYSDSACTSSLSVFGNPSTVAVTDRAVPNSAAITMPVVGTVYWQAAYAGDANNATATSACVALVVNKATPSLTLTITPDTSPMRAGGTATGSAALSGATGTAGGTVTYTIYTTNACTTEVSPPQSSSRTVFLGTVPTSGAFTFNQIGTVYWKAVYSGDADNTGISSSCVALAVVDEAHASLDLTVSPDPVAVEQAAAGIASLAGVTPGAGGTVTYTVFTNDTCTIPVNPAVESVKTVTNAVVPQSSPLTFATPGTRFLLATYSGDTNNDPDASPCVELTVTKTNTSLTLTTNPNPVETGEAGTGTATLAGASSTAGGSATYTVYTNNTCTTAVSPARTSTRTVANGVVPASVQLTISTAGTYYWRVSYTGDANNNAATSPCVAVTVAKASVTVNLTTSPASVMVWDSVTAVATLTDASASAGGTLTYTVYTDDSCTVGISPTKQTTRTVSNGVVTASAPFTFDAAGSVYWQAVYSGDANNETASSACVELEVIGGSLTASIASAQLPAVTYSANQRTNTGTLVLSVTDQRGTADGWTVSISMSNFIYSGASPNAANIPASSFSVTNANAPTLVRGQAISGTDGPYVPSSGATGPLSETLVVLVAETDAGAGEYRQTLNVSLVIPAQSQVGTYTAVIQTLTSAAP